MSQTNTRAVLTAEQKASYNASLKKFVLLACKANGLKARDMPVIIAPEMEEIGGEWFPIESDGARIANNPLNESVYVRLVQPFEKVVTSNGIDKVVIGFNNCNQFYTKEEWLSLCDDNDYRIGSIMHGMTLVVEETTTPSKSTTGAITGGWQPKLSGVNGVQLLSNGLPIYRRTVPKNAVNRRTGERLLIDDKLVAHDNGDAVKSSALKRLADKARKTFEDINGAKETPIETPAETPVAESTEPTTTATTKK